MLIMNSPECVRICVRMLDIEKAQCQFLLSSLQARLQVSEIERVALNFELGSPQIAPERKAEATARRDALLIERGETLTKLESCGNCSRKRDDRGRAAEKCDGTPSGVLGHGGPDSETHHQVP